MLIRHCEYSDTISRNSKDCWVVYAAAQKQIFSPPSQALPGTAVVRRLRLIPSPGRAWGRARVPFLLESLASALWTTRNDTIAYLNTISLLLTSATPDQTDPRAWAMHGEIVAAPR